MKIKVTFSLALMLAASGASMPLHADIKTTVETIGNLKNVEFIKTIDFTTLKSEFIDEVDKLQPVTTAIVKSIVEGDWATLRKTLKDNDITVAPMVTFLMKNLNQSRTNAFKDMIQKLIPLVPTNNTIVEKAVTEIQNHLNVFDTIGDQLQTIMSYTTMTNKQKDMFVDALAAVADTPEFAAAKKILVATFNNVLAPAFDSANSTDFGAIKDAADLIAQKVAAGKKTFDFSELSTIVTAINAIRALTPLLPAVLQGLAQTFVDINNVLIKNNTLIKAPQAIQDAMKAVADNASYIRSKLEIMLPAVDAELKKVLNSLGGMPADPAQMLMATPPTW